jgi:signal transduction histidine kinase
MTEKNNLNPAHELNTLSNRLRLIRWELPASLALLASVYQIGFAPYVHDKYGDLAHYGMEVFLYALIYPIAIWIVLGTVHTWVEQKEGAEAEVRRLNIELQQLVEERTHELLSKAEALTIANERLRELDQLKSEFVSLVSHELRAPLTNMRGAIELMQDSCPGLNATCSRMFNIVTEQIGRLGRMVSNVLNVSHIESGGLSLNFASVDIVQITDMAIDEIAIRQTNHIFRRPGGTVHLQVWADADRLYEVVANLVDNAAKYSPPHSEVVLEVQAKNHEAIISVSDSGPGIPIDEQDHIFEKFHRLDTGDAKETYGYGLGLYLCRRLVEAMGGRIWVESEPGHGATFHFALPLVSQTL